MQETAPTTRWSTFIFCLVWLASSVYLGMNLNKGWVPHDEGTLGQSAERVLHGEMPHRDFDDPYTGGLAYIDAAIFKLFGINLLWLRIFLFVCFVAWVPAVYALAREFLTPWPAAGITLVAVAWSVPNYPAAVPSWFNLFFATFGTLALAKYIRTPAIKWLVLAGLSGGLSFLIKSVAIYYIAAALLFFVYREQSRSRNQFATPRKTHLYLAFLTVCLLIFVLALVGLVLTIGGIPEYLHFVFPGFAIALLLAQGELTPPDVPDSARFKTFISMAAPFLFAALLPVILFLIFCWSRGALGPLADGLFAAPFRRLHSAYSEPPGIVLELISVFAALLIIVLAGLRKKARITLSTLLLFLAALILWTSSTSDVSRVVGLHSAWGTVPVLALVALLLIHSKRGYDHSSSEADQQLTLLITITVLFSLIQFPFSELVYFCYVAPFAALAAAALLSRLTHPPRAALATAIAFYTFFGIFILKPTLIHAMNRRYDADGNYASLPFTRAGKLLVPRNAALEYETLIAFIKDHARESPILAGPDCPEIYFLSGLRNPTPLLFDFVDEPQTYKRLIQGVLDRPDFIRVVVLNETPEFSSEHLQVLRNLVNSRFSESRKIGVFTLYWRP